MSDVHLEFGPMDQLIATDADILVLAGDILVGAHLGKSEDSPYHRNVQHYDDFMLWAHSNYKHVIYIPGNHEFYKGDVTKTWEIIKARYAYDNFHILDGEFCIIENNMFFGACLWTDMGGCDPNTMLSAQYGMNDYRIIKNGHGKWQPKDAIINHRWAMHVLASVLNNNKSAKDVIVVTHMAPSFQSISPEYVDSALNGAYATNLEKFILDNPQIKLWMHGHIHSNSDYMIGDTRIVANPRGYHGHAINKGFNDQLVIEL